MVERGGGGQDQLWRKKGEYMSEENAQIVSVFAIYKGDEILPSHVGRAYYTA